MIVAKKTYRTPDIQWAGTVAGLTRSNTPGPCADFENARGPERPGNPATCAPAPGQPGPGIPIS